MIVQPIVPWLIIVVIGGLLIGFGVWQLVIAKTKDSRIAWVRRTTIAGLIAVMSFGFSVPGGQSPSGMLNLDVIFVVDTTTSMGAEDYNGKNQRLVGAREDIVKIADKMAGARFAIISFDKTAKVALPMTTDRSSLATVASALPREPSTYTKGSSIDIAIDEVSNQLKTNQQQNAQRPSIIFYLGDGEQTVLDEPKSFSSLATYVKGGAVLGYGTEQGGEMKRYYGFGEDGECSDDMITGCYVLDYSTPDSFYTEVRGVSKIDETNLKNIATDLNVPYQNRNNGGDIDQLFDVSNVERIADASRQVTFYTNLYYIFAIPLLGLIVWEAFYLVTKLNQLRAAKPEVKS